MKLSSTFKIRNEGVDSRHLSPWIKAGVVAILFFNTATLCALPHVISQLPWYKTFKEYHLSDEAMLIPFYLNDTCQSDNNRSSDTGSLWRIPAPVARHYGIEINDCVDFRYDIDKESACAAKYLSDLNGFYKNDTVAILIFMNGATAVNHTAKVLDIDLNNVSENTLSLLNDLLRYRIKEISDETNAAIDTVDKRGRVVFKPDFMIRKTTLCQICNLTPDKLKEVNPALRDAAEWIYPSTEIFITGNINNFLSDSCLNIMKAEESNAFEIYCDSIDKQRQQQLAARQNAIKKANAERVYIVKQGDTLSGIAHKTHTTVRQIKTWNGLKSDMIRVGQKLKIKQ